MARACRSPIYGLIVVGAARSSARGCRIGSARRPVRVGAPGVGGRPRDHCGRPDARSGCSSAPRSSPSGWRSSFPALLALTVSRVAARRAGHGRRDGHALPRPVVRLRPGRPRAWSQRRAAIRSAFLVAGLVSALRLSSCSSAGSRPRPPRAASRYPRPMTTERVLVAGAGLMGHGIAQVLAATGRAVALYEPDLGRATAGRDRIAGNLERSVDEGPARRRRARRDPGPDRRRRTTSPPPPTRTSSSRPSSRTLGVKTALWPDARSASPPRGRSSPRTRRRSRSTGSRRPSSDRAGRASSGCTSSARCRSCR